MTVFVIGGGLVGLGTARALRNALPPSWKIEILEKESRCGEHQSTHNSGVLHAGLYYKPGSLKAKLAVEGIRKMVAFCAEHDIAHEVCGKVVVATNTEEVARLKTLLERGTANGLRGLQWLSQDELREVEPHAAGVAAVRVPEEGIVDYRQVCDVLVRTLATSDVFLRTNCEVSGLSRSSSQWLVETNQGTFTGDYIVNCGGLHCDRIAALAGNGRSARIVPFRGEYFKLRKSAEGLVRHLIYPVPDPAFPFLGVHFTRMIQGGVEAGPNAVLAYSREGYTKTAIRPGDLADALTYRGFWAFLRRHRSMAWDECVRSYSRRRFCESLQKLVPDVTEGDLEPGGSGVRAQAMLPDGTLVQDFHFQEEAGVLHVLNAPSPAATASLAIGELIAEKVASRLSSLFIPQPKIAHGNGCTAAR